jgi:riboflavin kinase/FMN adenylyltransferase
MFMEIIKVDKYFHWNNGETAATIGFFDGVHSGHRFLIEQLKKMAKSKGIPAAVVTFPEHPQSILHPQSKPDLLTCSDEKLNYLASTGIDICFLMDFTKELSLLDAETFIGEILHEKLNIKYLLIGYDHRFGKNREAGFEDYLKYGAAYGISVVRAEELAGIHISSTAIRKQLYAGNIEKANRMLSYDYALTGIVIPGNKLGRKIDFPTANLQIINEDKVIPGKGIYAAWVYIGREKYLGMAYIGTRPTVVADGEQRIEVHILGFSGDLYGQTLRLEFFAFIREDKVFDSLTELKNQLIIDKESIMKTSLKEM